MIKNGKEQLVKYITILINIILKYNVFPKDFNTSIILPIIKDSKLKTFDLNNFRPLSISNVIAQIFENVILLKSPELEKVHTNQFGFRKGISTLHPLFLVKETINRFSSHKTQCYLVKLDAEKAYDFLWRDGLFHKLRDKLKP